MRSVFNWLARGDEGKIFEGVNDGRIISEFRKCNTKCFAE